MRRRSGFTLVEILVAVAILAILISLAVWGYRHASAGVAARSTEVSMKALKSMYTEYEVNGNRVADLERLPGVYGPAQKVAAPQSVAEGLNATDPAILATRRILNRMSKVPQIQRMISDLPPEVKGSVTADGPILLDSHRNPIIYVPTNGLTGVNVNKKADGTYDPQNKGRRVFGANGTGIWASAGDDGNFANDGADNEYSDATNTVAGP